jgi:transcriptional regulator with XRE-family HTH domain
MSTPIGKKIRNIREALEMGRQEFVDKTGIPKNSLIGIEVGKHEPGSKALIAIAGNWPEYAEYLLTDDAGTIQKNPEIKLAEKKAGMAGGEYFAPLFSPDLKPEDMDARKMKKLQQEYDNYVATLGEQSMSYQEALKTKATPPSKK